MNESAQFTKELSPKSNRPFEPSSKGTLKVSIWLKTPNPMLGGLAPQVMMCPELIEKLHSVVKDVEASNQPADDQDDVMIAATAVSGDADLAEKWFRNHPIDAFQGKTANQLVLEGRANDVLRYLEMLEAGPLG